MDEEKLHNALSSHIRTVFDNYEDTGADEGWLLLRKKFPVKREERNLAWLWYAAAAIVLLCLGIWLIPGSVPKKQHSIATARKPVPAPTKQSSLPADTAFYPSGYASRNDNTVSKESSYQAHHSKIIFTQNDVSKELASTARTASPNIKNNSSIANTDSVQSQHQASIFTQNDLLKKQTDSINHSSFTYRQHQAVSLPGLVNKKSSHDLFNEKAVDVNKATEPEHSNRKVTFSVYAATYVNYAKGSDNPVNIGAGFTSDVRITNHLKLSTGLAIAQNRLNYDNDNLPNPSQHEATFASLAASAALSSGKPLTGDGTMKSMIRYATTLNGSKNYNANLTGLDIPVNLKYEFNPKKNDTYIAAGISSGTFINETYRSVYTYSQVSEESDTHNSFSRFDFAKTLNVSFGVGYPLGKNRLIVEPFFKYPLDGLGAQQIKFGSSGVNLRLHFR